jgi:hypothetical protein
MASGARVGGRASFDSREAIGQMDMSEREHVHVV